MSLILLARSSGTSLSPVCEPLASVSGSDTFYRSMAFSRQAALDLTRFAIQAKGPDGKWTRKSLAYRESNNVHLPITRPPEICVNLVFKHIHAASSYTIC